MTEISHERLKRILRYSPNTGDFTWVNPFNRKTLGKKAGYSNGHGYWIVEIDGKRHPAHRLAWFYMTEEWPKALIDHKDCDGLNNGWANIRQADHSTNTQNSRRRSDNTSGFKGVHFAKATQKWRATIGLRGRRTFLGDFETVEAAHTAYIVAAQKLFGEFARVA